MLLARSLLLISLLFPWLSASANLRGVETVFQNDDEARRARRRLEQEKVAKYWTLDRVQSAIPKDMLVSKKDVKEMREHTKDKHGRNRRRHLAVYSEIDKPAPHRIDDESIHLITLGHSIMECSLRHEPHDEETASHLRRLRRELQTAPKEERLFPKPEAVLSSSYIDFVVDVYDADDDIYWIAFFLQHELSSTVSRTKFKPTHGNGRYTLTLGPFPNGDFQWSIRARDQRALHSNSRLQYDPFSVRLPDDETPTLTFPTPNSADVFSYQHKTRMPPPINENPTKTTPTISSPSTTSASTPDRSIILTTSTSDTPGTPGTPFTPPSFGEDGGGSDIAELPPDLNGVDPTPPRTIPQSPPITDPQEPPRSNPQTTPTTNEPPKTIMPPTPPLNDVDPSTASPPATHELNFSYFAPSTTGMTRDPVTFDWQVTGEEVLLVLLYVEYPDGEEAYMTRSPTSTGRDQVSVTLSDEGSFRWSIWAQTRSGVFQEGPWQTFYIEEGTYDPLCPENLGHYTDRNNDFHKAVGRIVFTINGHNYLCSGTLVDGANDRAVIATAAHCIFDAESQTYPSKVMFIPGQDDGEGDSSDYNCFNDANGCFYPTVGVISDKYRAAPFSYGFQYDYGFLVAPDEDPGSNNGPDRDTFGGDTYKSLRPMGISFSGMDYGKNTRLYGYPGNRDAKFLYSEGRAEQSPITEGGWYVQCSGLTGGASGGPWTQSNPASGRVIVGSINSWGWTNGDPGMGSPPFDTGGAECVYAAANDASMDAGYVVAQCPE